MGVPFSFSFAILVSRSLTDTAGSTWQLRTLVHEGEALVCNPVFSFVHQHRPHGTCSSGLCTWILTKLIPVSRLTKNNRCVRFCEKHPHPRCSSTSFPVFSFMSKELGDKGMGQEQTQLSLTKLTLLVLVCSVADVRW